MTKAWFTVTVKWEWESKEEVWLKKDTATVYACESEAIGKAFAQIGPVSGFPCAVSISPA